MKARDFDKKFGAGCRGEHYQLLGSVESQEARAGTEAGECGFFSLDDPDAGQGGPTARRAAAVHHQGLGGRTPAKGVVKTYISRPDPLLSL